jgi:hypothetical protein
MARIWGIEKGEGGTSEERMTAYFDGLLHPQHALPPRVIYVAHEVEALIGYIAGHLTRRFGCDGELEWLYVINRAPAMWNRSGLDAAASCLVRAAECLACVCECRRLEYSCNSVLCQTWRRSDEAGLDAVERYYNRILRDLMPS